MTPADMAMRAALGDANIIAWYDARFPWTITLDTGVSAWADGRPASPGPSLVQATDAAQPVYSGAARTITFDGTADFLRESSTYWNAVTGSCWLAFVVTVPAGTGTNQTFGLLSVVSGTVTVLTAYVAGAGSLTGQSGASPSATRTNPADSDTHAVIARRTQVAGDATAGVRLGTAAEGTATAALAAATANRFTLGGNGADTPASFGGGVLRAVLVGAGAIPSGASDIITQWARTVHGAVAD